MNEVDMGKEEQGKTLSVDLARVSGSAQSKRARNETTLAALFPMKGGVRGCVILEGSVREENSDVPSYPNLHFGIPMFRRELRKIGTMAGAISLPYHCILLPLPPPRHSSQMHATP